MRTAAYCALAEVGKVLPAGSGVRARQASIKEGGLAKPERARPVCEQKKDSGVEYEVLRSLQGAGSGAE